MNDFIDKYGPYLEDIRARLYHTTIFFAIVFIAGFAGSGPILRVLLRVFKMHNVIVAATSPFQLANLSMDVGFLCAMSLSIPVVAYQIFSFCSSALSSKERRNMVIYFPASILLFIAGFVYAFFILYYSFRLFSVFGSSLGIQNIWDVELFFQTYTTALLLGCVFQMPLILTALIRLGFMKVDFLKKKRRIAWVIIMISVSLLPPTDGLSLIVMSLPLILLYEASIFINRNI